MKKVIVSLLALTMMMVMIVPVGAAKSDFVPSIEVKPGPTIVPKPGEDGTPIYGVIVMPDGTEIPLPEGTIIITPVGDKDKADADVKEALENALKDLQDAESLEDIVDGLKEILEAIAPGTTPDDISITDLFHVEASDDYTKYFEEGGKLVVTITSPNDIIGAFKDQGDVWGDLGDNFIDNGDGTYTLIVDNNTVVSLIKNSSKVDVDPDNPGMSSPSTGDMTWVYVVGAIAFVGAAVVLFVFGKKQKA